MPPDMELHQNKILWEAVALILILHICLAGIWRSQLLFCFPVISSTILRNYFLIQIFNMLWIIFITTLEKIPLNIFKQDELLIVLLWPRISILQQMFQQILNIKSLPMTCTRLRKRKKKLWQSHFKAMVVFSHKLDSQLCLSKLVQELISLSTKFPTKHTSLTVHNISLFEHQHYLVIFRDVSISDSISTLASLLYTSRKIHVLLPLG